MAIIKMIIAYLMCLTQILTPFEAVFGSSDDSDLYVPWSAEDTFDEADYIEIKKNPQEDFVILNLADVQLGDDELYGDEGVYSFELINKLVEEHKPDLITLSGDNATGTVSYLDLIELIDSFGIPWAPIMGNHEGDGCISEYWIAYKLQTETENCLFQFGPEDMGYGNYIINITENGRIIHTLYMMDTHDNAEFTLEDGSVIDGYDHLWNNQLQWYEWAVKGNKALAGYNVPSTVMIHIPVFEIYDAWDKVSVEKEGFEFGVVNSLYSPVASGNKYEESCPSAVNNGFFDLCKDLGSTKTILFGHDHKNDFTVLYEGIKLTYGVKSGFGSYWSEDMIGATTLTVNSLGLVETQQNYYDLAENGWNVEP